MCKITSPRLLASPLLVALASLASAQTAKPATRPTTRTTTHHTATSTAHSEQVPCSKLPEISPKVPALPAGLACAKPLYTITVEPSVKLDYISSQEVPDQLRKTLGLESSKFSLDYVDTHIGTGQLATPDKWLTIRYTGYLTDGTKFDSSEDHPGHAPFVIAYGQHQVIPGWDTGFSGMRVGGKRRLFIPYQLAYGSQGRPPIPPKAELIFDVELVAKSDTKPTPPAPPTPRVGDSASPTPARPATPPAASQAPAPAKTTNPASH